MNGWDSWDGRMNWPLEPGWKCEICGTAGSLTWGMTHGVCRCDVCHTQYAMRDHQAEGNPRVTTPICLLKPEFKAAFLELWPIRHCPVDQITDDEWLSRLNEIQAAM